MLQRIVLVASLFILLAAAPPPKPVAPATLPHPIAMFLADLCSDGKKKVAFKAAAMGTRFFFEETAGVTVYAFDGNSSYRKETFLKGYTLARAMKKYAK